MLTCEDWPQNNKKKTPKQMVIIMEGALKQHYAIFVP